MIKRMKKLTAILLAFVFTLFFAATAFAAKLADTQPVPASGYGTLTGQITYAGMFTDGRKNVGYGTSISRLYGSLNTTLYANIDIKDYETGVHRESASAPTVTNQTRLSASWQGRSDTVNKRTISIYGNHEVRGSGTFASYTNIYGF